MHTAAFWGKLIHDLRKEQGLSEYRLANEADISRPTLRKIEAGGKTSVQTLERLLTALGYELDAIRRDGGTHAV